MGFFVVSLQCNQKHKVMYTVIANAKTLEGRKVILRQTLKTKKACEFFIQGAKEVIEVIDYSINKIK